MDKEPNINIWKEISVNELVLDASKVEQKYEKQQEKVVKTLQWNHSPAAGGSTWVLSILWRHFYGVQHEKLWSIC